MNTQQLHVLNAMDIAFWQLKQPLMQSTTSTDASCAVLRFSHPDSALTIITTAHHHPETSPLTGKAGQLLSAIVFSLGLDPEKLAYQQLNTPEALTEHLRLHPPKAILSLGTLAADMLSNTATPAASLRGQVQHYHDTPWVATDDIVNLLHQPQQKAAVYADLQQLVPLLSIA